MRIERMTYKAVEAAVARGEIPRRRRVVLGLDWRDYWQLKTGADEQGMTLSNYIRMLCELPEERQGVKRPEAKATGKGAAQLRGGGFRAVPFS